MRLSPRIGGPSALSWPAVWVVLAVAVFLNRADRYTAWTLASTWRNLLCNVIAVAAMFAVMWVLASIVMRDAATRPHPWRAIFVFSAGAVTRALVLAALLPTIGTGEAQPAYRVVQSLFVLVPVLAITANIVDLVRTSTARRAAVQAQATALVAAEQEARAKTADLRDRAAGTVQALLRERLEALRDPRAEGLQDDLRRDAEQVIRPLSHQLFAGEPAPAPVASMPAEARVAWGDVWRSASLGRPFRAAALATLCTLGSVNALINYNGSLPLGLGYAAAQWALIFVSFTVVARLLVPAMRGMRVGSRTLALVGASIVGMVPAGLVLAGIIIATSGADPWRVPLGMMTVGAILCLVLALDQGFRRQVAAADAQQSSELATLQAAAAIAGSSLRYEERRLSRALHGPVQTAVAAAAIRIEAGDQAGAEAMLLDAVGQLDPGVHDSAPVASALRDVADLWEGLCTVEVDLAPGLDSDLDAQPALAGVFIEVCAEACSNAVRHGGARHVWVRARRDGGALALEVDDDGAPGSPNQPGLGTALLDDVALSWERQREGDRTVMRALLQLAS